MKVISLKNIVFYVLILLFSLGTMAHASNDSVVLPKLNLIHSGIRDVLTVLDKEQEDGDGKSEKVFVIRSKRIDDKYELRFSVLHKNDFSWFLLDKNDKLRGYFFFKRSKVLVFGDDNDAFTVSNETRTFNFIKLKPYQNGIVGDSEPPIIFEPLIWIYTLKDKKINFIKKGRYYLLE